MQTYRASWKRLALMLVAFTALAALICAGGPRAESALTFGFVLLCLVGFAAIFCAKWPILTISHEGVRLTSGWSNRLVEWAEIRSANVRGWGPFGYVALARTKGSSFNIPAWFEPSPEQLLSEISRILKDRNGP